MACGHVVALGDPQIGNGFADIGMLELILTQSIDHVLGGLKVSCLLEDGEEIGRRKRFVRIDRQHLSVTGRACLELA